MSKYIIDGSTLTDIADAIREEGLIFTEHPEIYTEDMANRIRTLQTGTLPIEENGVFSVKGIASVDVNVPSYPEPTGSTTITENGTYNVKDFAEALVNVAGGGGLSGFKISTGSFVMQQDQICISNAETTPFSIPHNLGAVPMWASVWIDELVASGNDTINHCLWLTIPYYSRTLREYRYREGRIWRQNSDSGLYASTDVMARFPDNYTEDSSGYVTADSNFIHIGKQISSNNYKYILRAGNTYRWFAIAKED